MSLILDGRYTDLTSTELKLPGFQLGGEAGLPPQGFATGHNELTFSSNIDDKFYGSVTAPIVIVDGEAIVELEEAFIETLSLGNGFVIKGGKFFSGIGYLNGIHDHAHDFADRPLVYDALFGGHAVDTGVQFRWVAPTDFYLSIGTELTTGSGFPGGENADNNKGQSFFVKTGSDIGSSSSWQLGASHYATEFDVREVGGHHDGEAATDNELLNGEVDVTGVDFVYKWAPNGNSKNRHFKLQAEYFSREENASAEFAEGTNSAEASYAGEQEGYYLQAAYQFIPAWRIGARLDHLEADNLITDFVDNGIPLNEFLEESGLGVEGNGSDKISFMVDYSPSHFSRIRLQFSELDNGLGENNDIITLQYIMSLGSHGAHTF